MDSIQMSQDDVEYIKAFEDKLDDDIGYHYYKKYIAASFWSQLSLPMNLSITIATAITTGQAATEVLLSQELFFKISVFTLIISVLNTFFRPNIQMNKNIEIMKHWQKIGNDFEEAFYTKHKYTTKVSETIEKYKNLQKDINRQKQAEGADTINFLTDLIHLISIHTCLKGKKWLSLTNNVKTKMILSENKQTNPKTDPKPADQKPAEQVTDMKKTESESQSESQQSNTIECQV
jgi:hypothetical protein